MNCVSILVTLETTIMSEKILRSIKSKNQSFILMTPTYKNIFQNGKSLHTTTHLITHIILPTMLKHFRLIPIQEN